MISKNIEYLLHLLGTDNTRIAAYAGCSESNFSRLRSGSRVPSPDSQTVKRYANAVYLCAADRDRLDVLCDLIDCQSREKFDIIRALINWMFNSSETMPPHIFGSDPNSFGSKLDSAMKIADLSNSRLSRLANIDPSYISRMRSGERMPRNNPELIETICEMIVQRAEEISSSGELMRLMGLPEGIDPEAKLSQMLAGWLYEQGSSADMIAVKKLISSIRASDTVQELNIPEFSSIATDLILNDTSSLYYGVEGLRRAVTRFLANAALNQSRGLILYSDQNMEWMSGVYTPVWATLMRECMLRKVPIKIIHNLDRSPSEMLTAISNWLPLYMSGMITPYYSTKAVGERFSFSVFYDIGKACIEGLCVKGAERDSEYRYITDISQLIYRGKQLDLFMESSRPLLLLSSEDTAPGDCAVYEFDDIRLCIGGNKVIIGKLGSQQINFTFDHPLLVRAFKSFADRIKPQIRPKHGSL
ncbi:MAG: helix-turn-helix transcriptional regulator [Ruminococcus sp.]|nr:helix-turn-helix transcriptional regulator [Ruminococcus sp.]